MSEDNNTNTNESNGPDIYNESDDADDGEHDRSFRTFVNKEEIPRGEEDPG